MAKGGSQLNQLKSALNKAGLTPSSSSSSDDKKRKRSSSSVSTSKDKERQHAKLEHIQKKFNAFDTKETKLKHEVLGQGKGGKVRGQIGKPGKSKQAGLEARKKTLLHEWENRDRAGGIVDRRFGENDATMSVEEKMLERFTRERLRASKGANLFNLEDEDEGELTHYGQSLSKLDDFDSAGMFGGEDDDDEEEGGRGQIERKVVQREHFGGFGDDEDEEEEDGPPRKKSKAEVMAEVIAKSKEHKLRRQLERERDDNIRHQLDQDFDSLRSLLLSASTASPDQPDKPAEPDPSAYAKDSTYDTLVHQLSFDARSKPKDRTKTEEELAEEERERLLKAEKKRRAGMLGIAYDSDEEGGRRKRKKGEADDLEDDFQLEGDNDWEGVGAGISEDLEGEEEEEEDEEGDEEGSDDDIDEEMEDEQAEAPLPFTFPCPTTHAEFLNILKNVSDEDVPTVVKRIRALYHPSLGPDNKSKLQVFTRVLLDHIIYVTPNYPLLRSLLPHLAILTKQFARASADAFVANLGQISKSIFSSPSPKITLPHLTCLRLIPLLFPTSDLHHIVVSPARLILGAYLSQGVNHLDEASDFASGLLVSSLVLDWEGGAKAEGSKRFMPEVLVFLGNVLVRALPGGVVEGKTVPGSFPLPSWVPGESGFELDVSSIQKDLGLEKLDLPALLAGEVEQEEGTKLTLVDLSFTLLRRFAEMWEDLPSFPELFEPFLVILGWWDGLKKALPKSVKSNLSTTLQKLRTLHQTSLSTRTPLQLQSHKPIPLPSLTPLFSSTVSPRVVDEETKLQRQLKKEKKGAIRELRKDARFLAKVEQDKAKKEGEEYEKRIRKVIGGVASEGAALADGDKKKGKRRK